MKVYVGNLAPEVTDEILNGVFREHGDASARVVKDLTTGQSRGFAYVEMQNEEAARTAIRELDGTDLHGNKLIVS